MKFTLGLLFFTLFFSACANAPLPAVAFLPADVWQTMAKPERQKLSPKLQSFLNQYAQYFEESMLLTNTPGAAIVIVKDSQIVYMRGFGPRIVGTQDSIDEHTVFRIGSLSKGFAGILTGIMVQDSLMCWDDPVQKYYPAFTMRDQKQASRIRLWHLLSHTSGLPYHAFTHLIEQDFSVARIVTNHFPKAPLAGLEGQFYAYQNVALCVIEEVLQGKTMKTYPQLLSEKIFAPAGMRQASCDFESIQSQVNKTLPHFATGRSGWQAHTISPLYYNAAAAGGVNASIADMGQWLKLLLGNRPDIVTKNTLDQVFQPVVKTDRERRIFPHWLPRDAASYAMGWRVLDNHGETILYHGGYVNGYKSEIALDRRDGIGICVLFNSNSELSRACIPEFFDQWNACKQ